MHEVLSPNFIYIFSTVLIVLIYLFVSKIKLQQQLRQSKSEVSTLSTEVELSLEKLNQQYSKNQELESELQENKRKLNEALKPDAIKKLTAEISELEQQCELNKSMLDETNSFLSISSSKSLDIKLGFFDRMFPLDSSSDLKIKIKDSQKAQKAIYEAGEAVKIYYGTWTTTRNSFFVHSKPYKEEYVLALPTEHNFTVLNDLEQWSNLQLLLNAFNSQCEKVITSVKYSSLDKSIEKIWKIARHLDSKYIQEYVHLTDSTYDLLKEGNNVIWGCGKHAAILIPDADKLTSDMGEVRTVRGTDLNLTISDKYIEEKINELKLQYEYVEQKYIESEKIKEEKRLAAELKKVQLQAEKEEELLQSEINNLQLKTSSETGQELKSLQDKIAELTLKLEAVEQEKQRAISMAQQTRTGYVYVISNIGTMGEGVVKIGMTRRIDPMERVRELGDASVPFSFDVHTIIRTDDAPKLEKELHDRFKRNRVNLVNNRKEFFKLNLVDVKQALDEIYPEEFDFNFKVTAFDYHRSTEIRDSIIS
jgi:uncharacterized protein YoxC